MRTPNWDPELSGNRSVRLSAPESLSIIPINFEATTRETASGSQLIDQMGRGIRPDCGIMHSGLNRLVTHPFFDYPDVNARHRRPGRERMAEEMPFVSEN